jgi:hypothetical protein
MDDKMKLKNSKKNNIDFKQNKKAQVTIFVIIALLIVVSMIIIFVILKPEKVSLPSGESPHQYIEQCTSSAVLEAVELLEKQGGYLEPVNYKLNNDEKISYLCYNRNYYEKCVNSEPMLIESMEEQIKMYVSPRVENCFNTLKNELENKHYEIEMKNIEDLDIQLKPQTIEITIDREFKMSKNDKTQDFKTFKIGVVEPIYDLANVVLEIVSQESRYCNFEYVGYMILYPKFDIKKYVTGDGVKIYTIKEISSEKEFKFATRGCVIPPGFG